MINNKQVVLEIVRVNPVINIINLNWSLIKLICNIRINCTLPLKIISLVQLKAKLWWCEWHQVWLSATWTKKFASICTNWSQCHVFRHPMMSGGCTDWLIYELADQTCFFRQFTWSVNKGVYTFYFANLVKIKNKFTRRIKFLNLRLLMISFSEQFAKLK